MSFEKSLKRLQTDYVDYYLLHEGLPGFLTDEALSYILDLKKDGKVRFIGLGSNSVGIKKLTSEDVRSWDVLQYDFTTPENVSALQAQFPDKLHFHHSCLQHLNDRSFDKISADDKAGYVLANAAMNNKGGKIIFSTNRQ